MTKSDGEGPTWAEAMEAWRENGRKEGRVDDDDDPAIVAFPDWGKMLEDRTDASRGRGTVKAAAQGGRTRRGKRKCDDVTDARLRAEVQGHMEDGESLTNARRKVGEAHGIPYSTVRDRTR